jgi:hypothetical protein
MLCVAAYILTYIPTYLQCVRPLIIPRRMVLGNFLVNKAMEVRLVRQNRGHLRTRVNVMCCQCLPFLLDSSWAKAAQQQFDVHDGHITCSLLRIENKCLKIT